MKVFAIAAALMISLGTSGVTSFGDEVTVKESYSYSYSAKESPKPAKAAKPTRYILVPVEDLESTQGKKTVVRQRSFRLFPLRVDRFTYRSIR